MGWLRHTVIPPVTIVWPALLPPAARAQMWDDAQRISTSLPFPKLEFSEGCKAVAFHSTIELIPSSPNWLPKTIVAISYLSSAYATSSHDSSQIGGLNARKMVIHYIFSFSIETTLRHFRVYPVLIQG